MTRNLAYLVSSVNEAQRRVCDTTPRTTEWRDAQRDAVHARLDYWDAMCFEWDVQHPKAAIVAEPPVMATLVSPSVVKSPGFARWQPSPLVTRLVSTPPGS